MSFSHTVGRRAPVCREDDRRERSASPGWAGMWVLIITPGSRRRRPPPPGIQIVTMPERERGGQESGEGRAGGSPRILRLSQEGSRWSGRCEKDAVSSFPTPSPDPLPPRLAVAAPAALAMAMSGRRKGSNSVELPPLRPNAQLPPPLLDSTEEGATSTSSSRIRSVSTTSTTTRGSTEGESGISHFSVSTILGLRGITSSSTHNVHAANATTEKLKGEKARSLLKVQYSMRGWCARPETCLFLAPGLPSLTLWTQEFTFLK